MDLPRSWQQALAKDEQETGLFAALLLVHEDGARADLPYSDSGRGAAQSLIWTSPTGERVEVLDLTGQPGEQVLGGAFDGRYLVFSVYDTEEMFSSPWRGYVWDSVDRGAPVLFASSPEEDYPDGAPGAMPLMYPLVREGVAYWVQSDPTEQERDFRALKSYDIATRATETVARGPFSEPMFFGDSIVFGVWPDQGRAHVEQVPLAPSYPVLPSEILGAGHLTSVAANGERLAWVNNRSDLSLYDASDATVTAIAGAGSGAPVRLWEVSTLTLNDDLVTFYADDVTAQTHQYIYDQRSGSVTDHTPLGSSDFHAYPGFLSVHHTDDANRVLEGSAVVAPMSEVPPLPACAAPGT